MSEKITLMLDDDLVEGLKLHMEKLVQSNDSCTYTKLVNQAVRNFLEN